MQSLVDFLNHGLLPFAGRDEVLASMFAFWRGTPDRSELRLQLLLGEAGLGKSRLVEEILPRLHREGGLAVHTKLLPETSGSIMPLLASALWKSDSARFLLRHPPQESAEGVLGGLRRLGRLRPLLLVIEDAHLLRGETLKELASLLEGLSDESVSVLIAARPLNAGLYDVVAPYVGDRIELTGLSQDELASLCNGIFGASLDPSSLAILFEATAGNPLAVRSALRGALAAGAIEPQGSDVSKRVRIDRKKFDHEVRSNAGRIGSGMAAHLTPEEHHAAEELATLGEAFARETALALFDGASIYNGASTFNDASAIIERLTFRGILTLLATPMMPLVGLERDVPDYPASSAPLLSFTHTLLHRHFLDAQDEARDRSTTQLARCIAEGLPLYSLLPIHIITKGSPPELPPVAAANLLQRIRYITLDLIVVADYQEGSGLLEGLRRLVDLLSDSLDPDDRHDLKVGVLFLATGLDWYGENVEENGQISTELLALTENPQSVREATQRIAALAKVHRLEWHNRTLREEYWQTVTELVEEIPDLRYTYTYALFLTLIADYAINAEELDRVREVETRLHDMEARHGEEHPEGKRLAATVRGWIGPVLLRLFETPEELQRRLEQMDELDAMIESRAQRSDFLQHQIYFFTSIGLPDRALATIERALPLFRQTDNLPNLCKAMALRLHARTAIGVDLDDIERDALRLLSDLPATADEQCRHLLGEHLSEAGMLRGDKEWSRRMTALVADDTDPASPEVRDWLDREKSSSEGFTEALTLARVRPILSLTDILRLHHVLDLVAKLDGVIDKRVKDHLREVVERGLEWLADRRLAAYMGPLLDRAESWLTSRELKAWRSRCAALQRERITQIEPSHRDNRVAITMFGTITVRPFEGEAQKISGARMKAVLGLIVGAAITERPMSHREFCMIATGEDDPERGRNTVYVRLHALRELLGPDAILTETDQAPRLNHQRVTCDLLQAHQALHDALDAARDGALMRSTPALMRGLELAQGEVAFPGLYEDFFETAREDFENLLRTAILRIASDLMREGDIENAERVLRQGYEAIPDDEEIAEKFCEALVGRGRRSEAERVRREIVVGV